MRVTQKMKSYYERLRTSYRQRKQINLPPIRGFLLWVIVFIVSAIFLTLYFAPEGDIDYHFRDEKGGITALSAILLAIAGGFAGVSHFLTEKDHLLKKIFWLFCLAAFIFFAWDELMQVHEFLGQWIRDSLMGSSQIFRNWNDLVVILYGFAAFVFFLYFLPTIISYPMLIEILVIGFLFYITHTAIDSLAVERTSLSIILEESCKLLSSASFACAMFVGLLGNIVIYRSSQIEDK